MTDDALPGLPDAGAAAEAAAPPTAGAILARAREAAGLTLDDVAMQLKLAPRQVTAIERDDYASLPGRTFVRGFVRNYARLLKLDVDATLAALPGEGATAALDRPTLAATTRAIGELPTEHAPRAGTGKWAIPLVLAAIVAIAALYEFSRPPAPAAPTVPVPANPPAQATEPPASGAPAGMSAMTEPGTTSTPLPNPVTAGDAPASAPPAVQPAAPSATVPSSPAPPAPAAVPATASGNQLALRFRGTSWVEVRDRTGNVVLSMTGNDGATREIGVSPPGEIVVGNAAGVEASWRGKPLDIAAQARQNVARVRLD
ncbi:MAG: helix-turn-helix domain-containing protein [Burkholderiales bacterium]